VTSYELWFRLLRGDADQVSGWLAGHGINLAQATESGLDAIEADHAHALLMDGDRNILLLRNLTRRPGLRRPVMCRCTWLGEGTPEHEASSLCRSLRPDADRDPVLCGSHGQPMVAGRHGDDGVPDMLCVCTLAAVDRFAEQDAQARAIENGADPIDVIE
jgi:hypothetical protein